MPRSRAVTATDLSRPQLFAMTQIDRLGDLEVLQPWLRRLVAESGGDSLLRHLEDCATRVLNEAGAESHAQRPPISVKKLAASLGAHVEVASGESTNGFPRGMLERAGPLAWRVVVTKPTYSAYRFTIAHELGHTLLYRHRGTFDSRAWQASTASTLEEALANYLGRFLLAPDHLVVPRIREHECAAEFVCRVLMDEFGLPLRQAIVRWLDLSDRLAICPVGGLIWEQYHAFDPARTTGVMAAVGLGERFEFSKLLDQVRSVCGTDKTTKEDAELFWQDALAAFQGGLSPLLDASLPPALEALRKYLRSLIDGQHHRSIELAIEELCGTAPHLAVRPEWYALLAREAGDFVPCKRGHARPASLVASVARGSADVSSTREEDVALGTLVGRFRVHVAARGNWSLGTRRIVQLLVRTE